MKMVKITILCKSVSKKKCYLHFFIIVSPSWGKKNVLN